jgi:uncharacterized membrane protein
MDAKLAAVLLLGLAPGFEPRYAAPLLAAMTGVQVALLLALTEVILLSALLTVAVKVLDKLALQLSTKVKGFGRLYRSAKLRAANARRLVERYGVIGLAAFVAIPLPFTGMYTGALAALIMGLDGRRTFAALLAGGFVSTLLTIMPAIVGVGACC